MRLVQFLEKHAVIPKSQYGFQRGKSTEDAVLHLTNVVSTALDQNSRCIGVFLDLAKAFDTVSVPILLRKMESLGIRGLCYNWFLSYLNDREQCIKVGQVKSDLLPIKFGVPQGSVLGPTLFLLYISDLFDVPLSNAEVICYADDTVLLFTDNSWKGVFRAAEKGLALVSNWLDKNLLSLNIEKTKYLTFFVTQASSPPQQLSLRLHSLACLERASNSSTPLICDCHCISRVGSIKYLGVTIDQRLSFANHIVTLSSRIRKTIFIMKSLRQCADIETLLLVYKTLCQSLIMYCIKAWGGSAKTNIIVLERAQRAVLKVMLRKPYRYPTESLYKECGVLSVRQLFVLRTVTATHKATLCSQDYKCLVKRRLFKIQIPWVRKTFSKRLPLYLSPYLYNIACNKLKQIRFCTTRQVKEIVENWLLSLNYTQTESLLPTSRN